MIETTPARPSERRPETGDRCMRCHRTAPRSDGIPCGLCAPHGPTFIDRNGVTHYWGGGDCWTKSCEDGCTTYPFVSDAPIDCMTCLVKLAEMGPW